MSVASWSLTGPEGSVALIRLDRPPVNALNSEMHADLLRCAREIAASPQARAVLIWGGEKGFAGGADIAEMAELNSGQLQSFGRTLTTALEAIAGLRQPVIAAVTRYALGGGFELALAADLRIVADDARLGVPEVTLGVMPGAGGTQRLARLVGPARAKELIFTGRPLKAPEAVALGIAMAAYPADRVYDEAMQLATRLASGATAAIAAAKSAIDEGLDMELSQALRLEADKFASLFDTEDQKTGMRSFLSEGPGHARFAGR